VTDQQEPHHHPASIGWADFCVRCPGCDTLLETGDDWDEMDVNGCISPKPEWRFIRCEHPGCGMLLELPDVQLKMTWSASPANGEAN
jgi:hypothetical protein